MTAKITTEKRVASRSMTRRAFLRMVGLSTGSALLSACQSTAATPVPTQTVQLVYQDWNTEWFPPMAQEMLEQFHEVHPDIHTFYMPDPDNLAEQMLIDMQAGTAPDLFQGCCSFFPIWAQEGYALDLRPYVEVDLDQATIDDWDPAQYEALFLPSGEQYGLPKYHGALALYFNKDLFDEYGVDYPDATWDHDDYLAAMQALTLDRNGDGETDVWGSMIDISWERVQMHVNGWGGRFVDPDDPTRCLLGEPQALEAMEWLRARMWDDRVMATPLDVQNMETRDAFATGKLAMVEDGSWALKDILAQAEFRVGVAPFPAGPERRVTLATTDAFGIFAGTKHPDAAWNLLQFLISPEYGRAMARANLLQPARASLVEDWVRYIREAFPEKAAEVDIATFAAGHLEGYSVVAEIFANMADAQRLIYAAWDKIFVFGREPVDIMHDVCREVQASQEQVGVRAGG